MARERRKRELDPMIKLLDQLAQVKGDINDPAFKTFNKAVNDINKQAKNIDKTLDVVLRAEETWFWGSVKYLNSVLNTE